MVARILPRWGQKWRPAAAEELPPEAERGAVAAVAAVAEAEVAEVKEAASTLAVQRVVRESGSTWPLLT